MQGIFCRTCNAGQLVRRRIYRMSGPVVVIGYFLLIPSLLGVLCSVLMVFASGAATTHTVADAEGLVRQELKAAGVPDKLIDKAITGASLTQAERNSLTIEQQTKVDAGPVSISAIQAGAGVGGFMAGGIFVCVGISCFIGGLLGWLLVMKKRVLQCTQCGAVVAAS